MQIIIEKNYEAMSEKAAGIILNTIIENPSATLCLAAGDTPRRAYGLLAEKIRKQNLDVSQCKFVSLDEWVGLPPNNEGTCTYFLNTVVFEPMNISNHQVHLFNALSDDMKKECAAMDAFIKNCGGIDLIVVGIGRNGHIGFNEPGVAFERYAHVVDLDDTTRTVGQKYFREKTTLSQGITLGLNYVLEAKQAILVANGENKAEVIRQALEDEINIGMPASVIRRHNDALVILDEAAASLLQNR